MVLAMAHPEPKRGMHSELSGSTSLGFDKALLSQARAVLRNAPDLRDKVMAGALSVSAAFAEAEARGSADARVADGKEVIAEARDDDPPPRPHRRPPAEIITPSTSAQLVTFAHEALDEIVSLMGRMSQLDRVRFQQEAMERLGGHQ